MDDFLERLKREQEELQNKINKLTAFIVGGGETWVGLSKVQQALLSAQLDYMNSYNSILMARLEDLSK